MRWKRRLTALMMTGIMAAGTMLHLPRAEAVDAWAVAAQALGVLGAYKSSLSSILAIGNNADAQIQSRRQDILIHGIDPNDNDVQVVDQVMNQLVSRGDYALKANSLPFCWTVNDSREFNAACYPTNYISINKALVRGLNLEPDELAAVLAHEMTHGIEQHSAHNYAKAAAQYYGMSFLNMDTGVMDWNKLAALADYSIAKNVTLPTEYDADEGGFYIMTSAGFNPGGGAAAMARMAHYLTYETQDIFEYQDPDSEEQENYNDHPDTERREQKLADRMRDYGCGHVTVKDRRDIYIDGQKLLRVDWTGSYDNTLENAYFTAGALAKAFHDYDSLDEWQFRPDGYGGLTCLPDDRVYETLRYFLAKEQAGVRLQELAAAAYAGEAQSGARTKMKAEEDARRQKTEQARAEAWAASEKAVKKMRENGDVYSDYGLGDKALFQMERVFSAKNPENEAENYAIRGRAKAVSGDYAGGLKDCGKAVLLDEKNAYNYLNRADVYHMAGNFSAALKDLEQAAAADKVNPYASLMSAQIYDEQAERSKALESYREFYRLRPKAFRAIPVEYLQDISEKDCKILQKEKEEARREYEKQWKEKQKEQKSAAGKTADKKSGEKH